MIVSEEGASFQQKSAARLPGEPGIWVLICGDTLVFSLFFITFVAYRNASLEVYAQSQNLLNLRLGLLNTILLLTSSWFVASAVQAARGARDWLVSYLLTGGIVCGAGFVIVKVFEYQAKLSAGLGILSNEFFMFYFMFTGIHLLHVLIGLGILLWLRGKTSRQARLSDRDTLFFESGATFWHLVDVLWIVLFALLYLAR